MLMSCLYFLQWMSGMREIHVHQNYHAAFTSDAQYIDSILAQYLQIYNIFIIEAADIGYKVQPKHKHQPESKYWCIPWFYKYLINSALHLLTVCCMSLVLVFTWPESIPDACHNHKTYQFLCLVAFWVSTWLICMSKTKKCVFIFEWKILLGFVCCSVCKCILNVSVI